MVTGKTVIGDLLDKVPEAAEVLLSEGMHCLGCPTARSEAIEEACEMHDIDLQKLLDRLNSIK